MKNTWLLLLAAICCGGLSLSAVAQDQPIAAPVEAVQPEAPKAPAGAVAADELALTQSRLADKYARLEELMLKMASLEAAANPRRAALLTRAVEQSKERLTKTQLDTIVKLLNQQQLKRAVDGQTEVQVDLKSLLDLLLSEDRSDRLKSDQARIREYIKEVERLIRLQKGLEGQNQAGGDAQRVAKDQEKLAGRTGDLAQKIKENEEGGQPSDKDEDGEQPASAEPPPGEEGKPGDAKPSDGDAKPNDKPGEDGGEQGAEKPGDGKPMDGKSGDKPEDMNTPKAGDEKPADPTTEKKNDGSDPAKPMESEKPGDGQPTEGKPNEGNPIEGKPSEGKPSEGKPSEGKPSESQEGQPGESSESKPQAGDEQQAQDNPARQRIEQAQQKMQDAQKKLEEAKRKESAEDQRAAREQLEKAKAELEEILRQMREEEVKRTLAQLEQRFKKMLEMQLKVYESTRRLDQLPVANRNDQFVVESGKLSFDERKIALEAFKALTLLQEEGSSVAFPASVEQMHEDMEQVAERLGDTKIDEITIGIEEDIVAALEEMIEALQKAQQDMEEKEQQQQQQQQQGQEQDQPLVDQIAELKMIKALQLRVNKRTTRYARLLEDEQDAVGQATGSELVDALQKLSQRQQDIFTITRDIVLGKNK